MSRSLRRVTTIALLAVAGMSVFACGGGGSDKDLELTGTDWSLRTLNGQAAVVGSIPWLAFATPQDFSGSTGCNSFNGTWKADGDSLTITPGAMTLIGCQDPVASQETAYIAALNATRSAKQSDNSLELFDENDKSLAVFDEKEPADLVGPTWYVVSFDNGTQGTTYIIAGTQMTAKFGSDGMLNGDSGCNTYSAGYEAKDGTLTLQPIISTQKACEENIMTQESQYLAALQKAMTYVLGPEQLVLHGSDGGTVVTFSSNAP